MGGFNSAASDRSGSLFQIHGRNPSLVEIKKQQQEFGTYSPTVTVPKQRKFVVLYLLLMIHLLLQLVLIMQVIMKLIIIINIVGKQNVVATLKKAEIHVEDMVEDVDVNMVEVGGSGQRSRDACRKRSNFDVKNDGCFNSFLIKLNKMMKHKNILCV